MTMRSPIHFLCGLLLAVSFPAAAFVDVATFAKFGTGDVSLPWAGWDTAVNWQPETEYFFRKGYYAYSVSPNFLKTGIALRGEAGTVLQFTGSGNAVVFDNPGGNANAYANWTENVRFENFIIQGNANTTNGLFLRAVRNGIFRHVSVRDVSNACLWGEALVTNMVENFRCTHHEMPNDVFNVVPAYGIVLGSRGAEDSTTTTTVTNAVIEGISQVGIWIMANSFANTFIGGTSEGNLGKGMVIDGQTNTLINMDFEGNGGTNVEINDANNQLQGVVSEGLINLQNGYLNKLRGRFSNVNISNRCDYTDISGSFISVQLVDQSQTTVKFGYFLKSQFRNDSLLAGGVVNIPVANAAIATDASQGALFSSVLTADTTLLNPTNGVDGQLVTWRIQQDGVGGHVLQFSTNFVSLSGLALPTSSGGGLNPLLRFSSGVINPAPLSYSEISGRFNAATGKWQIQ